MTNRNELEVRNTRDRLLQVGLRHIRSMGYASTGVQEILNEADVPKGSFCHPFTSKEAFAEELLKLYVGGEKERTEKILRDGRAAPLKRLRRYFEELIAVYGPAASISSCLIGNLSLEMAEHSDPIQSLLHMSFSNWQAGICRRSAGGD